MRTILSALSVLVAGAASAEPVAVFVTQTIQIPPEEARAFAAVCTAAYQRESGLAAVPAERAAGAFSETHDALAAAKKVGAQEYVSLELLRLTDEGHGSRIIVTQTRGDVSGAVLHRAEMDLATFRDSPETCTRLARAAVRRVSIEQTRDRHTVTEAEAEETGSPVHTRADKLFGVKTGIAVPVASGGSYDPMGSMAFSALLERERGFFELGAGFSVPSSVAGTGLGYGGLTSEMGASYYLEDTDITPFVGGGVLPRIIFSGAGFNLAPYAQVGMMFSRESRTRFFAEARVAQNLMPISDGSTLSALPTELTLHAGMTF